MFGKTSGFGATLELSSLDGNNGFKINGEVAGDKSGYSVSSAGDVNGDGFADLIVSARYADPGGNNSGASYVIFGSMPREDVVRAGTGLANTIHGGEFDDTLSGLAGDARCEPAPCRARPPISGGWARLASEPQGAPFDKLHLSNAVSTQRALTSNLVSGIQALRT